MQYAVCLWAYKKKKNIKHGKYVTFENRVKYDNKHFSISSNSRKTIEKIKTSVTLNANSFRLLIECFCLLSVNLVVYLLLLLLLIKI